ncbi:MAG: DUF4304 domain-containing protein [Prevotella sp.]|nr:DUF4304 domain-containing protein [Prevotella sp.]
MFSLLNNNGKFKLRGNRSFLRTDYEISSIDKDEADNAFKLYKKQYIDTLLKSKGFRQFKTNAYVRRNQVDVLEYIDLQKERNGSRTFTVNYGLTALYIPRKFFDWDINDRIGMLICKEDVWWDFADDDIARVSFENIAKAIEKFVIPWFDAYSNDESIKILLLDDSEEYGLRSSKKAWLDVIDHRRTRYEIVEENMKLFGLPKSLK